MSPLVALIMGALWLVISPALVLMLGYGCTKRCRHPAERKWIAVIAVVVALVTMIPALFGGLGIIELAWLPARNAEVAQSDQIAPTPDPSTVSEPGEPMDPQSTVMVDSAPRVTIEQSDEASQSNRISVTVTEQAGSGHADSMTDISAPTTSSSPIGAFEPDEAQASTAGRRNETRPPSGADVALLLSGVILLVGLMLLMRLSYGALRLRAMLRNAIPARPVWREHLVNVTGGSNRVRLLESPDIRVPFVVGWLSPTIVLPSRFGVGGNNHPAAMAIAHEWAHVNHRDLLVWHLLNLLQIVLWHQPYYWKLRSELRLCQDQLADAQAIATGAATEDYAELLLNLAYDRRSTACGLALCMSDRESNLARRIRMLTLDPIECRRVNRMAMGAAFGILALVALPLSSLRLVHAEAGAAETENRLAADAEARLESAPQDDDDENDDRPMTVPEWQGQELSYSGVITDKRTGEGIPNATVRIRRSVFSSADTRPLGVTEHTTDDEGRYDFVIPPEQTSEGALYIELEAEHANYASIGPMGYAMSMIRKNETLGSRPFFEHQEMQPAEPVTGVIVDPDGKPLSGVKLLGYSKYDVSDFREYGSFTRTETAEDGSFRLNLIKDGLGVFWIQPEGHAIQRHIVNETRGDLGTLQLVEGLTVSGQLIDARGNPIPDVYVGLEAIDETQGSEPILERVADQNQRGDVTDAEGNFEFNPVDPGSYTLNITEHDLEAGYGSRNPRRDIPAVFIPQRLELAEGVAPEPVVHQAVPHVYFNVQYVNSSGEPTRGHEVLLFGQIDGTNYMGRAKPDMNGTAQAMLPHGIEQLQVMLMTNEHGSLKYRRGEGADFQPNRPGSNVMFDRVEEDIDGFEIMRFVAPIVVVEAVDEEGEQIEDFIVWAEYTWGDQRYIIDGGRNSDIAFNEQADGRRRTSQMLPDEQVTFHIEADGYESVEEVLELAEGEEELLRVTLKKKNDDDAPVAKQTARVLDAFTLEPVVGASVSIERTIRHRGNAESRGWMESLSVATEQTDSEGTFEFTTTEAERLNEQLVLVMKVAADGYAANRQRWIRASSLVVNESSSTDPIDAILIYPSRRLTGRLVDHQGDPVAEVLVRTTSIDPADSREYRSQAETYTDADGRFALEVPQKSVHVTSILPSDHAIDSIVTNDEQSLGEIKLSDGVRVHGQLLDARGEPVINAAVNLFSDEKPENWPYEDFVVAPVFRGTRTDEQGRFQFSPMTSGQYKVVVAGQNDDQLAYDRALVTLDETFVMQNITIGEEASPDPLIIQAVPHIEVIVALLNENGEPLDDVSGSVTLWGRVRGELFTSRRQRINGPRLHIRVPHGLEDASLSVNVDDDYVIGSRRNANDEITWQHPCRFGDLVNDSHTLEIVFAKR